MYTLEPGMPVQDSRGRSLGTIAHLRSCCLEPSAGPILQMDALIAVDQWGALVCDVDHRRLFRCPTHGDVKAEPYGFAGTKGGLSPVLVSGR
jgi:hypothetical protein